MSGRSFFSRIFFGRSADRDETSSYSAEETGLRKFIRKEPEEEWRLRSFTIERAARIIDDLPPDVPRESAVRIVRGTLAATGVELEDLERSTRTRESKLDSEIELARNRQEELRKSTEETVRSLEEEIRKTREARDTGIAEEEERISRAMASLEEVRRVRTFFGFSQTEGEEIADSAVDPADDETQVLEPFMDKTQEIRRPDSIDDTDGPIEGPSTYGSPHGTTER